MKSTRSTTAELNRPMVSGSVHPQESPWASGSSSASIAAPSRAVPTRSMRPLATRTGSRTSSTMPGTARMPPPTQIQNSTW
jgi:hypothetical protein